MDLDELKQIWQERDGKLDERLQLHERLLRTAQFGKAETALQRLSRWIWIELLQDFVAAILLGSFIANHIAAPEFWLMAAILQIGVIASIVRCIRQLCLIGRIDYGASIVTIQRQLETLRIERIRVVKWTILLAPLAWTPLFIVSMKGILGVNVYTVFGIHWVIANVIFGIAAIPVGIRICRRFADRAIGSAFLRGIMNDIGGQNLNAATGFIHSLSQFETA